MNRGDVILVGFPHPTGLRGKKRPAVIVQSDAQPRISSPVNVALPLPNASAAMPIR